MLHTELKAIADLIFSLTYSLNNVELLIELVSKAIAVISGESFNSDYRNIRDNLVEELSDLKHEQSQLLNTSHQPYLVATFITLKISAHLSLSKIIKIADKSESL